MSGNKAGGIKARETNYKNNGRDFYKRIGTIGGSRTTGMKGFALNRELARAAGAIGGRISHRGAYRKRLFSVEVKGVEYRLLFAGTALWRGVPTDYFKAAFKGTYGFDLPDGATIEFKKYIKED